MQSKLNIFNSSLSHIQCNDHLHHSSLNNTEKTPLPKITKKSYIVQIEHSIGPSGVYNVMSVNKIFCQYRIAIISNGFNTNTMGEHCTHEIVILCVTKRGKLRFSCFVLFLWCCQKVLQLPVCDNAFRPISKNGQLERILYNFQTNSWISIINLTLRFLGTPAPKNDSQVAF